MAAVNNFSEIRPLLNFKQQGDFYYIQLIKRKKDQECPEKHQSARTIKTYIVESLEYFDLKKKEIIDLCDHFNCRAGINLHRRNHKDLAFEVLERVAQNLKAGNYNMSRVYDSVIGSVKSKDEPIWVIDFDSKDFTLGLDLLQLIDGIQVLAVSANARNLAGQLMARHGIPESEPRDALHISIAAVKMDTILAGVEFRHIANADTRATIAQICRDCGYIPPSICSPDEFLGT